MSVQVLPASWTCQQRFTPERSGCQPLYLKPHRDSYWQPNEDGLLEVPRGASIELYCSRAFANASSDGAIDARQRSIYARCEHDRTFAWSGGKRELGDFSCTQQLKYVAERMEGRTCGDAAVSPGARIYRVGYNISESRFVRTLELCHDATQLRTLYANYQLTPANVHFQQRVKRVKFSAAGHFVGYNMERLYAQQYQAKRAAQLLQQPELAAKLFDKKRGLFLSRGHLATKSDLIYASQQRSSFTYLNAMPQWQSLNGGNWATLETKTRLFVQSEKLTVNVYTGAYGVMPLTDEAQTSFYLLTDDNNKAVLPVPRLFYRVLIDTKQPNRGLAILGVNNPHATLQQILDSYVICEPLQPELIPWLRPLQETDLKKGYLYACRVSDLAKVVTDLPAQLREVHELLTTSQ
ncbi:uncharacterized protein LOC108598940 [Drosophila busckii]|uniref:uncharacterized protein LOC108598940 n=1 Tax=Drosophila busckii TaxID=30019 RepID=UPI001432B996|nr:uncharacterized protein LOC108598940 [Drosophila busckii]